MKEIYTSPEIEIVRFGCEDVITTSKQVPDTDNQTALPII